MVLTLYWGPDFLRPAETTRRANLPAELEPFGHQELCECGA